MGTTKRRLQISLLFWVLSAAPVAGQDPLSAAKDLYASARYDEALTVLNTLKNGDAPPAADLRSVEQYRSFCLIALGRSAEAEAAIAAVIASDPLYQPDASEVSPRVRTVFREVRQRLLPEIAANAYATAKATFDRKEYAAAADQFRQVLAILSDAEVAAEQADLRTLASGFLDLAVAAMAPPTPPAEPPPTRLAPAVPAPPRVYTADDKDVRGPSVIRQKMPALPAALTKDANSRGILEIIIDEQGRVESAAIRMSVHRIYDTMILNAAKDWRYKPATVAGRGVKYRKLIQVTVSR
jgi:TonB family protein